MLFNSDAIGGILQVLIHHLTDTQLWRNFQNCVDAYYALPFLSVQHFFSLWVFVGCALLFLIYLRSMKIPQHRIHNITLALALITALLSSRLAVLLPQFQFLMTNYEK
jgi:hypothetical protein